MYLKRECCYTIQNQSLSNTWVSKSNNRQIPLHKQLFKFSIKRRHQIKPARPFYKQGMVVPNGRCQRASQLSKKAGRGSSRCTVDIIMGEFDCGRIEKNLNPRRRWYMSVSITRSGDKVCARTLAKVGLKLWYSQSREPFIQSAFWTFLLCIEPSGSSRIGISFKEMVIYGPDLKNVDHMDALSWPFFIPSHLCSKSWNLRPRRSSSDTRCCWHWSLFRNQNF